MASVRRAFFVLARTFKLVYEDAFTLAACNVFWLLLCLPVVTAPASFAALFYVADLAARSKPIAPRDFFDGFRQYFVKGTLLGIIDLVLAALIAANLLFYSQLAAGWAQFARAVWIAVGVFWLLIQVYLFPMLVVQVEPKIRWALRNALMLPLAQPVFTVVVALELVAVFAASALLVIPLLTIGASTLALLSCVALDDRLNALRIREKQEAEQAGPDSPAPPA